MKRRLNNLVEAVLPLEIGSSSHRETTQLLFKFVSKCESTRSVITKTKRSQQIRFVSANFSRGKSSDGDSPCCDVAMYEQPLAKVYACISTLIFNRFLTPLLRQILLEEYRKLIEILISFISVIIVLAQRVNTCVSFSAKS